MGACHRPPAALSGMSVRARGKGDVSDVMVFRTDARSKRPKLGGTERRATRRERQKEHRAGRESGGQRRRLGRTGRGWIRCSAMQPATVPPIGPGGFVREGGRLGQMKRFGACLSCRVLVILAWLAVGMVLTVGVSWWQAVLYQRLINQESGRWADEVVRSGDPGKPAPHSQLQWPISVPASWPRKPDQLRIESTCVCTTTSATALVGKGASDFNVATLYEYGWPLRSASDWWRLAAPWNRPDSSEQGGFLSLPVSKRWPFLFKIPIRPLWSGFVLNTIFYAALAWGLWQLPLAIRRRRRRARGRCPRCAYALTGLPPHSPCPECGVDSSSPAPVSTQNPNRS